MKSKKDQLDFESYVSQHIAPEISKVAGVPLLTAVRSLLLPIETVEDLVAWP
jgi:hypothetical protein